MVALVIFLQFSVSGYAISIVATHMSLFIDLFAFISFKSRKTRMDKKCIFQNFEKLSISNWHIFKDYQMLTNFITGLYLTLLAL